MKTKGIFLILAFVLLAGCGKQPGAPGSSAPSRSSSMTGSSEAASAESAAGGSSGGELSSAAGSSAAPAASSRPQNPSSAAASSVLPSNQSSKGAVSGMIPQPLKDDKYFTGTPLFTNLNYTNTGHMGDNDGPAYVSVAKSGYNTASIDIMLSEVRMNLVRQSDGKSINAYLFMGINVHDGNGNFRNIADAGLVYNRTGGYWHLFHSIYEVSPSSGQNKWYESRVNLNPTHNYRLALDNSKSNGWATAYVYDLSDGGKLMDEIMFEMRYAKKDGSNTQFYQNYAVDFPDNVKMDRQGRPSQNDWEEITLYNTNQNLYMRNIHVKNAVLNGQKWTEGKNARRTIWPDAANTKVDYPCVIVRSAAFDEEIMMDLDMNRH